MPQSGVTYPSRRFPAPIRRSCPDAAAMFGESLTRRPRIRRFPAQRRDHVRQDAGAAALNGGSHPGGRQRRFHRLATNERYGGSPHEPADDVGSADGPWRTGTGRAAGAAARPGPRRALAHGGRTGRHAPRAAHRELFSQRNWIAPGSAEACGPAPIPPFSEAGVNQWDRHQLSTPGASANRDYPHLP